MDLFLPIFHLQDCTKSSIISSSILYGTTRTAKIQLQKSTTCHTFNNVGCMHVFPRLLRLLPSEKLRTFSLLQGSKMGLARNTLTMDLLWTWLCMTFLRSGNCQFSMQGVLWKSLHVTWQCRGWMCPSALDPLQLWCLKSVCFNGNPWPTSYWGIMVSLGVLSFHKWPNHSIIFLQH